MSQPTKLTFAPRSKDPFSSELSAEVDKYFKDNNISTKGNLGLWLKALFYLGGFFGSLALIYFGTWTTGQAILVYLMLGAFTTGIGFNVGHDALHDSFSNVGWVNTLMGHSYTLLGAHTYNWKIIHNKVHHTYTNIEGGDGDLETVKFLRFYPGKEGKQPYHRFQHLYASFLYMLTSLVWVFKKDFDHFKTVKHMTYVKPALPKMEFARLLGCKGLYFFTVLIGPMIFSSMSVGTVVLGFLCMHFLIGLSLAYVFQLGHLVEGPEIGQIPNSGQLGSWHKTQLMGTANFACDSTIATFLFGGLNQQVEHHLFPKISHAHYRALSPIVRRVAKKHGLPYHDKGSFPKALASHFRFLKQMGQAEKLVVSENLA